MLDVGVFVVVVHAVRNGGLTGELDYVWARQRHPRH